MIPGEIIAAKGEIELNKGLPTVTLKVANSGDRPIQVGSHYHFYVRSRTGAWHAPRHRRRHRHALRAGAGA